MNTDDIRATIAEIKNKHLATLQEEKRIEDAIVEKQEIRYGLARAGLSCLVDKLKVVFEDSHKLYKLGINITQRFHSSDPNGIYEWNGDLYGTHHHYIDIRHQYECGTIRVYTTCEPNLRVHYGCHIYDRSGKNNFLNGILEDLSRDIDGKEMGLVINPAIIITSHANCMGKLLAKSEM